ncbi:MAG: DUF3332 family protein [Leptospira sp.]|nr:DUF3332 family protein [Leptospira sp.]
MKRFLNVLLIGALSFGFLSNCFGKFGLVKTVYSINGNITIGSGKWVGFFRSVLMIFPFSIAYWVAGLIDVFIFNLLEFWTDRNPVGYADYDLDGKYVKVYEQEGQKLTFTYTEWGKVLQVDSESKYGKDSVYFLKDKPEKAFRKTNSGYVEIIPTSGPILPPVAVKQI